MANATSQAAAELLALGILIDTPGKTISELLLRTGVESGVTLRNALWALDASGMLDTGIDGQGQRTYFIPAVSERYLRSLLAEMEVPAVYRVPIEREGAPDEA